MTECEQCGNDSQVRALKRAVGDEAVVRGRLGVA